MAVSVEAFRGLLRWVTENYEVVPLAECIASSHPRNQCGLTFDDGWADVFAHAVPVMKEVGVTATIFLPTEFIGTSRRFWQERLCFSLKAADQSGHAEQIASLARSLLSVGCARKVDYSALRTALLRRSTAEAEAFVDTIEHEFGTSNGIGRAFMTWDEVSSMLKDGFSFGAHTLNHVLLTKLDKHLAETEIRVSRNRLEAKLNTVVNSFAYPWGDRNEVVAGLVRDSGYKCAVTTAETLMQPNCDRLAIPRVFVSDSILCRNGTFDSTKLELHLARLALRSAVSLSS